MIEKFFYIEPETARKLLAQIDGMSYDKRGVDRKAYLFDEYAVLSANRIKIRNGIRDDYLTYFDELIHILWQLSEQGVNVVPIYGRTSHKIYRDLTHIIWCVLDLFYTI